MSAPQLPEPLRVAATLTGLADWIEIELAGGTPAKAIARAIVVQLRYEAEKLRTEAGQ